MIWIIKDTSNKKHRKFGRAIYSKYGTKITSAVFVVDSLPAMQAILAETEWYKKADIAITHEIINEKERIIMFGM